MNEPLRAWRQAGKHLPECLRDFHDAKNLFRTMHALQGPGADSVIKTPNCVEGQAYVIDHFLWFMAQHGYTLQRSRAKMGFDNLDEKIAAHRESELSGLRAIIQGEK